MRITKGFDERRQEIIDKSSILFSRKGYMKTSVADIVREVEVAKGTFYYYFKSKDDVLDALIDQQIEIISQRAEQIANDKELDVQEKLYRIVLGDHKKSLEKDWMMNEQRMIETLHLDDNEKLHLKSIKGTIVKLAPIITQVIEQGIQEGVFNSPYPLETVELLLVSSSFLWDESIFNWKADEILKKKMAFIHVMEVSLGTPKGSLMNLLEVL